MDKPAGEGGARARTHRGNGQHPAAVFVAQRKAEEQVFDGMKADAGQVGRTPIAHSLQELKRCVERVFVHGLRHGRPAVYHSGAEVGGWRLGCTS